jgi:hypothetical protein
MVIMEVRVPAVTALMIATRHFLAPAFSLAGLFALAFLPAMPLALHSLIAALSLLILALLLLEFLVGAGFRRPRRWNDLAPAGTAASAAALHFSALAALALAALAPLCSLGEARAHRKPSQDRTQQENSDYR